jgi:hypothetical protein
MSVKKCQHEHKGRQHSQDKSHGAQAYMENTTLGYVCELRPHYMYSMYMKEAGGRRQGGRGESHLVLQYCTVVRRALLTVRAFQGQSRIR